ncbi:MAG: SEC-C metal-binding domain-containing protein, partial [Acidimicrobiia bacterium]
LKYDEVMNRQREVVYDWRTAILDNEESEEIVEEWIGDAVTATIEETVGEATPSQWDWEEISRELTQIYPSSLAPDSFEGGLSLNSLVDAAVEEALAAYEGRREELGADVLRQVEKSVVMSIIDNKWREHLSDMDYLRAGIGLRAMGQRDPLTEYQREGYDMFAEMVESVKRDSVRYLFHVQLAQPATTSADAATETSGAAPARVEANASQAQSRQPVSADKIGRNEPCPCGSGKKYKRCHGAVA